MGQSVTRVNDHHSVPGPLGHGMGPTPQVGVGMPHGGRDVTPDDEIHVPPPRRKQTAIPPANVPPSQAEINQLKQQPLQQQSSPPASPKTDESLLRRGWQATIGKFRHKPDDNGMTQAPPKGVSDEAQTRRVTTTTSTAPPPALKSKSLSNLDTGKGKEDMAKTNWQSSTPIALGMNTSGVVATPPGATRKLGAQQQSSGGFGEWWHNTLTMPPKYSPMNAQPDELHREHRSLAHGPIFFTPKDTAMPPKLSPWNAQPDELHRESHKWR